MMLSMMESGKLLFRRHNSLNLLAVSALVQLMIDPLLVFNIGFQLSYSAVTGILVLGPRIEKQATTAFPKLGRKTRGALSVCLAAQLSTAPLIILHFHQFPTYFLLSNLLLLPAVSLAVVIGFSGMLLIWVPGLGQLLFGVLDFILAVIAWLSGQISSLPGAVVENYSLSDPASLIFSAMVALLLAAFFRVEISKLNLNGALKGAWFLNVLTVLGQPRRMAGYALVAIAVTSGLLAV
jgi:competence protein ComEC